MPGQEGNCNLLFSLVFSLEASAGNDFVHRAIVLRVIALDRGRVPGLRVDAREVSKDDPSGRGERLLAALRAVELNDALGSLVRRQPLPVHLFE